MKLAALSIVYNEEKLVRGCIESFKPFVEEHVMVVGQKPYFGKPEPLDGSADAARAYGAYVIERSKKYPDGAWPLDHQQRNDGMEYLESKGYDWILISDVDMWFEHWQVAEMIKRLETLKEDAIIMAQDSYWHDTDHRLVGDDFCPVTAVRPHVKFSYSGNVNTVYGQIRDIKLHHLAWCAPKDIHKKVLTYTHAPEFDGEAWYQQYYKNWRFGQKAVLPTGRFIVAYNPLPDELKAYLPEVL